MTAAGDFSQDFNYKVALASGLRELQAGQLTKAERQFEYLCAKFPTAPGGYRGLAKVRLEQADRPGAVTSLRDGAAKLARAGAHAGVVALLTEALSLDPADLAAHRRLAAAHALAGELDAASAEYARYVHAVSPTDPSAAHREVRYGLDSLGPQPGLVALAREIGLDIESLAGAPASPTPAPPAPPATAPPAPGAIPGIPRRERAEPQPMAGATEPRPSDPPVAGPPGERAPAPDPTVWSAPDATRQRERVPEPALDEHEDALAADERAAQYIAAKDPRAAQAALIAARHFIADGRTNAASDLLLQLIASGLADHQAQRLLVDVVSSIGKRDVARSKCALLAEALRLDGQDELALEVERLAQAV
jgi:hypothetical protein